MWTLKELMEYANSTHTQINKKWVPSRPLYKDSISMWRRIVSAFSVLRGKADTFMWPENQ